jgi:hypothetical protein
MENYDMLSKELKKSLETGDFRYLEQKAISLNQFDKPNFYYSFK